MAGDIGSVYLDVLPSLDDFGAALSEGVLQDAESAGQAAGEAVGTALTSSLQDSVAGMDMTAAGTEIGDSIAEGVDKASDQIGSDLATKIDEAAIVAGDQAGTDMGEAVVGGVTAATDELPGRMAESMGEAGQEGGSSMASEAEAAAIFGLGDLADKLGGVGAVAGTAFAGLFGIAAIKGFEEDEKQIGRLEFGLQQLGIAGENASAPLIQFATDFAEKAGIVDETILKLEASLVTLGKNFLSTLGPDAALKVVQDLSAGLIQMSIATGRPLQMMMRSLGPSILNTPERAVAILEKFGALTAEQAQKVKDLSAAGDRQAATMFIVNHLTEEYAGIAEKAVTPSERMHVAFDEISDAVGSVFAPAMKALADILLSIPTPILAIVIGLGAAVTAMVAITKITKIVSGSFGGFKTSLKNIPGLLTAIVSPLGLVTVGLGIAAIAVISWMQSQAAARARVDELTKSLDEETGAITANTEEIVKNRLQQTGAFEDAKELGLNLNLVTRAALGEADAVAEVNTFLEDYVASHSEATTAVAGHVQAVGTESDEVQRLRDILFGTNSEIAKAVQAQKDLKEASTDTTAATEGQNRAMETANRILRQTGDLLGVTIDKSKTAGEQIDQMREAWDAFSDQTAESINLVTQGLSELAGREHLTAERIHRSLHQQLMDMRAFGKDLRRITRDGTKGSAELVQQLISMGAEGANMADIIASASPKIRHAIERDIGASMSSADTIADQLTTALVEGMHRIEAAIRVATGEFTSFKEALDAVNGTNVNVVLSIAEEVRLEKEIFVKTHRQHGGPAYPGRVYTVGEAGPETFVPSVAGTIVPHGAGRGGGPLTLRIIDWKRGLVELAGELEWIGRG